MPEKNSEQEFADVSVIIPAYNVAGTIARALTSVAFQTLKPKEAIVVDDGSQDRTAEIAGGRRDQMNGVELKIIRQNNAGAGAARNNAITHAQGKFLAFLDADDEWLPEKIEKSLETIQRGKYILVAHNGWIVREAKETYVDIAARFDAAIEAPFRGLYRRGFISTSSVVALRQNVLNVGGFDGSLPVGQDFDLWLKLLSSPETNFVVFDQPLTRYYISSNSITSQTDQRLVNSLQIALRHAPLLKQYPGFPLGSLWFRIVAVHWEALAAHWKAGKIGHCLVASLRLPVNTLILTLKYFVT